MKKLWVVDCLTGRRAAVDGVVLVVGSGTGAGLEAGRGVEDAVMFTVERVGGGYRLAAGGGRLVVDGREVAATEVRENGEHTVVANGHPFVLKVVAGGERWVESVDAGKWYVVHKAERRAVGPMSWEQVGARMDGKQGDVVVYCEGMKDMGFFPHQLSPRMAAPGGAGGAAAVAAALLEVPEVNSEYGEFTCPVCWFRFDRGDVMNIAVHAGLRGDPLLGEEHMQRFLASRFNDRGQALDAMGLAAPEIACPHCRRKLPPNFLDQPHHILSIVGAPSSGKSYYLSVLVKVMQDLAYRHFGVTFRDAAPSENAVLNDMRNHLFSASTPEEAYLAKTDLEGALYETLPRQGRQVRLPKPFVFRMSGRDAAEDGFSLVFYDNAGEHFEPGRNSADSPGAQHIAVASGILFLFDPLYNPEFRRKLRGHPDPQLLQRRSDQQDILLAESEVRIKEILGLAAHERIATPFAVIVGKSDAWLHLLEGGPLLPVVEPGGRGGAVIRLDHIAANSARLREFLLETSPAIVANAEAISSEVRYFAASPLGHAPVEFADARGHLRIGPDPGLLDPQRVEDPVLWVLSKVAPVMFPSHA